MFFGFAPCCAWTVEIVFRQDAWRKPQVGTSRRNVVVSSDLLMFLNLGDPLSSCLWHSQVLFHVFDDFLPVLPCSSDSVG